MSDPLETLTSRSLGGLEVAPVTEQISYINFLVYGDSGAGKTRFAGSAAAVEEMSPVLMIDVEGGALTLRTTYSDVDVVRVKTWNDLQKVYNDLFDGKHPYKTVVLDSLSEIQKFSLSTIMKEIKKTDPERDEEVPGIREWGKNLWQIRSVVRGFRDLPMHTIFTCLADHQQDPRTGLEKSSLGLQGQSKKEVPGHVDFIGYLYVKINREKTERFLLTQMTEKELAKDRSNSLPNPMINPTMTDIYNQIFNPGE